MALKILSHKIGNPFKKYGPPKRGRNRAKIEKTQSIEPVAIGQPVKLHQLNR